MSLEPLASLAWLVFWVWVVFLRGAEWLEGGWVMAYLIEPLPSKADPVRTLRLVGVISLLFGVVGTLILLRS